MSIAFTFSAVKNSITARCLRRVDIAGVLDSITIVTGRKREGAGQRDLGRFVIQDLSLIHI